MIEKAPAKQPDGKGQHHCPTTSMPDIIYQCRKCDDYYAESNLKYDCGTSHNEASRLITFI